MNKSKVVEDLCDTLSEDKRGEIMSIAQQIHQEGRKEGMEQGVNYGCVAKFYWIKGCLYSGYNYPASA